MKATLLYLVLSACFLVADDVTLAWNPNAPEDQVTGYRLYEVQLIVAPPGTNYLFIAETTNTTSIATNIGPGLHCFTVTAVNRWGESGYSSQACALIYINTNAPPPAGLEVIAVTTNTTVSFTFTNLPPSFVIQHGDSLTNWSDWIGVASLDRPAISFHTFRMVADKPKQFWRLATQ